MKRFLSNLLARLTQSRPARRSSAPQRRARLEIEWLEGRELLSAAPLAGSWQLEPGNATSIASGGGQIWSLNGQTLSEWTGSSFKTVSGYGNTLAVDPNGNPVVTHSDYTVWRLSGGNWQQILPYGGAQDVCVSPTGNFWIIGAGPQVQYPEGNELFELGSNNTWIDMHHTASAVAVEPGGTPWIIGAGSEVYRYTGSTWQDMGITASSIAIGSGDGVWITANGGGATTHPVYEWTSSGWAEAPGASGTSIAVTSNGNPWISNNGPIFSYTATPTSLPATHLVVWTQPGTMTAGSPLYMCVLAEDKNGMAVAINGSINLSLHGSTWVGQAQFSEDAIGIITVSGLTIDKAGSGYSITVTSGSLTPVTTNTFTVTPAAATHVVVITQPGNIVAGQPISFSVAAEDQFGNFVPFTGSVNVSFASQPAGSSFSGQLTLPAFNNGLLSLSGLTIKQPGSGYSLTVTLKGVGSVTTKPFSVLA